MATKNKFLGSGWQFPPAFNKSATTANTAITLGSEKIKQSLKALLTTNMGERLMRPGYGGGLDNYLFAPVDSLTLTKISNTVADAILLYEPRVEVSNIEVSADEIDAGLLRISIDYIIKATNSRFNLVYPFYINEASVPV